MNGLNQTMDTAMETSTSQRRRFWAVLVCFVLSLFFFLFQGGKLASVVFVVVSVLCLYLLLGRWSGVSKTKGERAILNADTGSIVGAGTQLAVRISVQIPGFWPVPYVFVKDRLIRKDGEELAFETSVIPDWRRRGELSYRTVPLRRGVYRFGSTECATEDIFGLFQHKGVMELGFSFRVLPRMVSISHWSILQRMVHGLQSHSASTRAYREMTQINGVREYNYGDRLSRIHWNATAKTGMLKSKEFERESLPKTVVLLDCSAKSYADPEQFELAVSVAASLVDYFTSKELAVGLMSVGREVVFLEPKRGAGHLHRILQHLTEVEPDGKYGISDVLRERSRHFHQGMFLSLVTPQHDVGLHQSMVWIDQRQMNPCHLWISPQATEAARETWRKQLRLNDYLGYAVHQLNDLPALLGGRKA